MLEPSDLIVVSLGPRLPVLSDCMNFTGTAHSLLYGRMTFVFIFYVLIHVEEFIVSSFKIEGFYNVDTST